MITLTILLIVALLCVLVGCLTGLLTLVGVLASLFVGVRMCAGSSICWLRGGCSAVPLKAGASPT